MEATKCMILNPYTKTLKLATILPNQETVGAILGTEQFGIFDPPKAEYSIFHSKTIWNRLTGTIAGAAFKSWKTPLFGMLILVGKKGEALKPEIIEEIQKGFETAKVERFKFSS